MNKKPPIEPLSETTPLVLLLTCLLVPASVMGQERFDNNYWMSQTFVDSTVPSDEKLEIKLGKPIMEEIGFLRRDPSDIIRRNGKYYVWYTKVAEDHIGFPEGWGGTIWHATSVDGHQWEEQGESIPRGEAGGWDDEGVFTPNILVFKGRYYLAYNGSEERFDSKTTVFSLGMSVADSPDGPWRQLPNNPFLCPDPTPGAPDGTVAADPVFALNQGKIWLYYKGNPNTGTLEKPLRSKGQTLLLAATAEDPEGPYTKIPKVLHRGHEAVLWKEADGSIGSLGTSRGPLRYYNSRNGIDFRAVYEVVPQKAIGIYRPDFEEGNNGFRPTWGIAQKSKRVGLHRIEFIWPKNGTK